MTEPQSWGIVGGGILGLELARGLRRAGHAVTVLEAAPHLGGLADAWQIGGVTWDRHYHVILQSDAHVHRLLADLGLSGEFRAAETRTGFYTGGELYSMSNSWEFLRFPPLWLPDKLRLAATIVRASRITDWRTLENVPVVDWLTRWSGRRTVRKIWLPLLRAKLGDAYKQASAAFIWATIARMYAARRSGLKKELFGTVRCGYAAVLARLAEVLADAGVALRTDAPVKCVEADRDGVAVALASGERLAFDRVVVTAAAPAAARMVPGLSDAERARLNGLTYQGIVCASLLLDSPLTPYYVTNITDDWVPFTAVVETTALVDPAEFGGRSLVYLPKYAAPNDPIFAESDDAIRERFVSALERMHPHFERGQVRAFRVSRVRAVFAVPTLGYSALVPPLATSVPGVYLANSAQITNGTLNVNETLQLADQTLEALSRLDPPRQPRAMPHTEGAARAEAVG